MSYGFRATSPGGISLPAATTERGAQSIAVEHHLRGRVVSRLSDQEIDVLWRSMERAGWKVEEAQ